MRRIGYVSLMVGGMLAGGFGCTSQEVLIAHSVPLAAAKQDIPEAELLDVGVSVFDPGVPAGEVDKKVVEELIKAGTFVQIRRSESLYMAVLLRDTLQKSGHWGSVWVTPKDTTAADLSVDAKILHSDGNVLQLHATAVDATGRTWLDKSYDMETAAGAFNRQRYPDLDPYQDVFNEIANDLAAAYAQLSAADKRNIRTVASMRYAADLSPEAFSGYVTEDAKKGRYEINRLPAEDDPQFDRTQRVRQRERLFLDTLDQHYDKFYTDATKSYDGWREYSREESIEVAELTKSARWRTGMGVATIVASIVYGTNSSNNDFTDRVIRDAMMYVGMDMLKTSQVRRQEKKLHIDTLSELSGSFDDEIKPMVVEVQGTEHRLTGTADAQYAEWRDLLRQMFVAEGGFVPESIEISTVPDEPFVPAGLDLGPGQIGAGLPAAEPGATDAASGTQSTVQAAPADAQAEAPSQAEAKPDAAANLTNTGT
jgi:hypothetical protein